MKRLLAALAFIVALCSPAAAAEPQIPNFWDLKERLPKPQLDGLQRLRFLTTVDFPPFNYIDSEGRLAGFHIDLARRICDELGVTDRCQIQALPWAELDDTLAKGDGEAILAGLAITAATRETYVFTRPYLQFAARFVMQKANTVSEPLHVALSGKRVGVIAGSAHEKMLRAYFAEVKPVTYSKAEWLYQDLRAGKIDGVFGDGMRLSFWLVGSDSAGCCRFVGGPYLAPEYLGLGLAIAVKPADATLADAFNFALRELQAKGTFAELYLRYFPVSFY
ncbi:MAG: transporter substrate-binding domain-containing protein [Mesorhizobium sp.]|nr:transporter substrate-binding domain-containing protein [Mesorhizobium sp.]MCO5160470.1 transporter substrate-binding domain-containing protein [Mesorhizobium sp.]